MGLVVAWLAFTSGFVLYHGKGYDHPPITYVLAPLFFVFFLVLGLHRYRTIPAAPDEAVRPAPGLWTLRGLSFVAAFVVFVTFFIVRAIIPVAVIPFVIIAGVDLLGILLVRHWSRRSGWGASHRLALTTGVMGFFMVISPLLEFKVHMTGITLVNLLALGGLIWLARRTASFEAANLGET